MSIYISRLIQSYHFQADLIWCDAIALLLWYSFSISSSCTIWCKFFRRIQQGNQRPQSNVTLMQTFKSALVSGYNLNQTRPSYNCGENSLQNFTFWTYGVRVIYQVQVQLKFLWLVLFLVLYSKEHIDRGRWKPMRMLVVSWCYHIELNGAVSNQLTKTFEGEWECSSVHLLLVLTLTFNSVAYGIFKL